VLALCWVFLPFAVFYLSAQVGRVERRLKGIDEHTAVLEKIHQQLLLNNKLLADARKQNGRP